MTCRTGSLSQFSGSSSNPALAGALVGAALLGLVVGASACGGAGTSELDGSTPDLAATIEDASSDLAQLDASVDDRTALRDGRRLDKSSFLEQRTADRAKPKEAAAVPDKVKLADQRLPDQRLPDTSHAADLAVLPDGGCGGGVAVSPPVQARSIPLPTLVKDPRLAWSAADARYLVAAQRPPVGSGSSAEFGTVTLDPAANLKGAWKTLPWSTPWAELIRGPSSFAFFVCGKTASYSERILQLGQLDASQNEVGSMVWVDLPSAPTVTCYGGFRDGDFNQNSEYLVRLMGTGSLPTYILRNPSSPSVYKNRKVVTTSIPGIGNDFYTSDGSVLFHFVGGLHRATTATVQPGDLLDANGLAPAQVKLEASTSRQLLAYTRRVGSGTLSYRVMVGEINSLGFWLGGQAHAMSGADSQKPLRVDLTPINGSTAVVTWLSQGATSPGLWLSVWRRGLFPTFSTPLQVAASGGIMPDEYDVTADSGGVALVWKEPVSGYGNLKFSRYLVCP